MKPAHYSVEHYADTDVAEGFDALRFSGPIGELVAEEEARVIKRIRELFPEAHVPE